MFDDLRFLERRKRFTSAGYLLLERRALGGSERLELGADERMNRVNESDDE